MTAKAYYPNELKKDKYKTVIASEFIESFSQLPQDLIRLMVGKVIDCISVIITQPFSIIGELSAEGQKIKIKEMREILNINYNNPTKRDQEISSSYGTLCRYRQNGEVTIELAKYQITNSGLQYPQEQEQELLRFLKEVATKCTQEICNATELKIKHKESSKPWTEKVSTKHKKYTEASSIPELIGKTTDERESWVKKSHEQREKTMELQEFQTKTSVSKPDFMSEQEKLKSKNVRFLDRVNNPEASPKSPNSKRAKTESSFSHDL